MPDQHPPTTELFGPELAFLQQEAKKHKNIALKELVDSILEDSSGAGNVLEALCQGCLLPKKSQGALTCVPAIAKAASVGHMHADRVPAVCNTFFSVLENDDPEVNVRILQTLVSIMHSVPMPMDVAVEPLSLLILMNCHRGPSTYQSTCIASLTHVTQNILDSVRDHVDGDEADVNGVASHQIASLWFKDVCGIAAGLPPQWVRLDSTALESLPAVMLDVLVTTLQTPSTAATLKRKYFASCLSEDLLSLLLTPPEATTRESFALILKVSMAAIDALHGHDGANQSVTSDIITHHTRILHDAATLDGDIWKVSLLVAVWKRIFADYVMLARFLGSGDSTVFMGIVAELVGVVAKTESMTLTPTLLDAIGLISPTAKDTDSGFAALRRLWSTAKDTKRVGDGEGPASPSDEASRPCSPPKQDASQREKTPDKEHVSLESPNTSAVPPVSPPPPQSVPPLEKVDVPQAVAAARDELITTAVDLLAVLAQSICRLVESNPRHQAVASENPQMQRRRSYPMVKPRHDVPDDVVTTLLRLIRGPMKGSLVVIFGSGKEDHVHMAVRCCTYMIHVGCLCGEGDVRDTFLQQLLLSAFPPKEALIPTNAESEMLGISTETAPEFCELSQTCIHSIRGILNVANGIGSLLGNGWRYVLVAFASLEELHVPMSPTEGDAVKTSDVNDLLLTMENIFESSSYLANDALSPTLRSLAELGNNPTCSAQLQFAAKYALRILCVNVKRSAFVWDITRGMWLHAISSVYATPTIIDVAVEAIVLTAYSTLQTDTDALATLVEMTCNDSARSDVRSAVLKHALHAMRAQGPSLEPHVWAAFLRITATGAKGSKLNVSDGFKVLEFVQQDCVTLLDHSGLLLLIETIGRYMAQSADTTRININLSSVQLGWSLSDYLTVADPAHQGAESYQYWNALMEGMSNCREDGRPEVRHGALKTLFSLIATHGARLPPQCWAKCLDNVIVRCLEQVHTTYLEHYGTTPKKQVGFTNRDTQGKQWEETLLIVVDGSSRLLRSFNKQMLQHAEFDHGLEKALSVVSHCALHCAEEVSLTCVRFLCSASLLLTDKAFTDTIFTTLHKIGDFAQTQCLGCAAPSVLLAVCDGVTSYAVKTAAAAAGDVSCADPLEIVSKALNSQASTETYVFPSKLQTLAVNSLKKLYATAALDQQQRIVTVLTEQLPSPDDMSQCIARASGTASLHMDPEDPDALADSRSSVTGSPTPLLPKRHHPQYLSFIIDTVRALLLDAQEAVFKAHMSPATQRLCVLLQPRIASGIYPADATLKVFEAIENLSKRALSTPALAPTFINIVAAAMKVHWAAMRDSDGSGSGDFPTADATVSLAKVCLKSGLPFKHVAFADFVSAIHRMSVLMRGPEPMRAHAATLYCISLLNVSPKGHPDVFEHTMNCALDSIRHGITWFHQASAVTAEDKEFVVQLLQAIAHHDAAGASSHTAGNASLAQRCPSAFGRKALLVRCLPHLAMLIGTEDPDIRNLVMVYVAKVSEDMGLEEHHNPNDVSFM